MRLRITSFRIIALLAAGLVLSAASAAQAQRAAEPPAAPPQIQGGPAPFEPDLMRLAEILARINELFAGEDFSASGLESWVQGVVTVLGDDPQIRLQAAVNTERQFTESPDLGDAVTDAVISNQSTHNGIVDLFFGRPELKSQLIRRLGELVWENLRIEREDDAAS